MVSAVSVQLEFFTKGLENIIINILFNIKSKIAVVVNIISFSCSHDTVLPVQACSQQGRKYNNYNDKKYF